jgi:hypothetical protein
MEKHFIDIFVPHRKLRKVYYLISSLLILLWIPDLNKLNIPLPSKVLEPWFLDKLLLTTIVLLLLYSFSTYFISQVSADKPKEPTRPIQEKKDNSKTNPNSFIFVENGDIKWKVHLACGSIFRIEDAPYCVKHDLQLLHFKGGYVCSHVKEDGCEAQLKDTDHSFRKTYVGTLAERQLRQRDPQPQPQRRVISPGKKSWVRDW